MFTGLDDIGWSSLEDAYGAAKSTPDMLRLLPSARRSERWTAIEQLYMGLCHQASTVYSATPYAVPFLIELAAEPRIPSLHAILELLGDIARATGYCLAHQDGMSPRERQTTAFQAELAKSRRTRVVGLLGVDASQSGVAGGRAADDGA